MTASAGAALVGLAALNVFLLVLVFDACLFEYRRFGTPLALGLTVFSLALLTSVAVPATLPMHGPPGPHRTVWVLALFECLHSVAVLAVLPVVSR